MIRLVESIIGPELLGKCLHTARENLEFNYEILNRLNVFPVPDGDTGTNMLSTFDAGVRALQHNTVLPSGTQQSIQFMAAHMNAELMRNSRGNSGFILARFFHGFFEGVGDSPGIGAKEIAAGFSSGLYQVNTSLFSPVEGTMITIIRAMEERLKAELSDSRGETDIVSLFDRAIQSGRESLKDTPRLLPVLFKAGVLDAGALGFIFIMEGFRQGLIGGPVIQEREEDYRFSPAGSTAPQTDIRVDTRFFSYCTEVNVDKVRNFSRDDVSRFLEEHGNSIALVYEQDFLKVHIHTDVPQQVIEYMKTIGTVEHVKIDNLNEQVSRYSAVEDPDADCAVLAFIPGEGFRDIYRSLGVEHCILYTAHMPSTGEVLEYIETMPEKNIIVLPNNGNILPAVRPAAEAHAKHTSIIHSGTIVQGLTAAYGYSANDTIEENVVNMKDCLDLALGLFVYRSTMDTEFDGQLIRSGEYFALCEDELIASGLDLAEVVMEGIHSRGIGEVANISFFYQDAEVLKILNTIKAELARDYCSAEIEFLYGGQFRENLIISLE